MRISKLEKIKENYINDAIANKETDSRKTSLNGINSRFGKIDVDVNEY